MVLPLSGTEIYVDHVMCYQQIYTQPYHEYTDVHKSLFLPFFKSTPLLALLTRSTICSASVHITYNTCCLFFLLPSNWRCCKVSQSFHDAIIQPFIYVKMIVTILYYYYIAFLACSPLLLQELAHDVRRS